MLFVAIAVAILTMMFVRSARGVDADGNKIDKSVSIDSDSFIGVDDNGNQTPRPPRGLIRSQMGGDNTTKVFVVTIEENINGKGVPVKSNIYSTRNSLVGDIERKYKGKNIITVEEFIEV